MEIKIPSFLYDLYKENHKNLDMALMTLLNSFDPKIYQKALRSILPIAAKENEDRKSVKIGATAISQIKDAFDNQEINEELINTLLWIAVLFPEI